MLPKLPSIAEAQTLMRRDKLRPLDLVEHCLGRIHQFEDQIHAWVMVDEEGARREAQRLGKMLDDGQEPVGPLHGIPIGIKDIIDVEGWPTLCGSKLREGHIADKDAFVVEYLRKAGAIILGKTVTTEWASFDPPPTRNPWNLNHTPGGSSSGSAAAVAMEMCLAALGTQTGGSIIRPASYCGVVGLKPHFQLMLMGGIYPFSHSLDHVGPIARSASDAEVVWREMLPHFQVREEVSTPLADEETIFYLRGGFIAQADEATRLHSGELQVAFSEHFSVNSFQLPDYFSEVPALHRCIMAVEGAEIHRQSFEENPRAYPPQFRKLIEEGRATNALDYARALRRQRELSPRLVGDVYRAGRGAAVLALPSTPTPAPDATTTGNPLFNSPWSFTGFSAVTLPSGLSPSGMPFGLQFVFIGLDYPRIFEFLRKAESVLAFKSRPSLLS